MLNFIQLELEVCPSSHQNRKELRKRTKGTLQVFFLACSGTSMASCICMFRNLCRCSKGSMCSTMVWVQTSPTFRTISGLQDVWQTWHFENTNADKSSAHHRLRNIFWLNKTLEIRNRENINQNWNSIPDWLIFQTIPAQLQTLSVSSDPRLDRPSHEAPVRLFEVDAALPVLNWWEIPRNDPFSQENHVAKSSKYWGNFQQTMFDYQRVDGRRVSLKHKFFG